MFNITKASIFQFIALVLFGALCGFQLALATPRTKAHYEGRALILLERAGWSVSEVYPDGQNTVISLKDGRILHYGKTESGDFSFMEEKSPLGLVRANPDQSEIEVRLDKAGELGESVLPQQEAKSQLNYSYIGTLSVLEGEKILYAGLVRIQKKSLPVLKVTLRNNSAEIRELSYRILQGGPKGLNFEKLPGQDHIETSRFSFLKPLICKATLNQ